ncbi:MAG: hypothetical protein NUV72_08535 [Bauldia sp.]|nr:hypothetical protein [Bauldia sp.]
MTFTVGQEVVYRDAGSLRYGIVERIHDGLITVLGGAGCSLCRKTLRVSDVQSLPRKQKMVPPPGAIKRMA